VIHGRLTPPALGRAGVRVPQKSQFLRQTFTQYQERRASAHRGSGDVLAHALPQLFGRLSSVRWRTPLQSRSCNHGGLRPPLLFRICDCRLAIGRLVMHERSGNHGGLTPPALGHMRSRIAKVAFPCERLPNRQGNSSPSHLFRRRCFRASQKSLFHRRANDVHQERRA